MIDYESIFMGNRENKELEERNREMREKKTCIEENFDEMVETLDYKLDVKLDYSISKEYYDVIDNYIKNEVRRIDKYYTSQDIRIYMMTKFNYFEYVNLMYFCILEWDGKKKHSRLEIIKYVDSIIETMENNHDYSYFNIEHHFPNIDKIDALNRLIILRDKLNEMTDYEIDLYTQNNIEFTRF